MSKITCFLGVLVVILLGADSALAQSAQVPFGGLKHDSTLPVEMSSDQLKIDQSDGSAIFSGNVVVGQGEMRLTAAKIRVEYSAADGESTGRVSRMLATGGVTLVNGTEAAESQNAEYTVDSGVIVMTGDVILTQGLNALSSEKMIVDLSTGIGTMDGRVRTILRTGNN